MPEYIYPDDELDIDDDEVFVGFIRKNCEMLIRCRDCTYYQGHEHYCMNDTFAKEDGYCHYAERKEE